jgi:DNA-directed RNA polymerase
MDSITLPPKSPLETPKDTQGLSRELTAAISKLHTQDTTELPVELAAAIAKHDERQLSVEQREGWGATTAGKGIVRNTLGAMTAAVVTALANPPMANSSEAELIGVLKGLDPEVIALCILQTTLSQVALQSPAVMMHGALGAALSGECWAAGLTKHDKELARNITLRVRTRHASPKQRKSAAKAMAAKAKNAFKLREWPRELRVRAGSWGVNLLIDTFPHLFTWTEYERSNVLSITDDAWALVDAALRETIHRNPVFFPMIQQPRQWDQWAGCGSHDPRVDWTTTFLRTRYKDTQSAAKHAIKSEGMTKALEGVNGLQNVGWRINTRMLDVVRQCYDQGIAVKGLPPLADLPLPERTPDDEWALMDEGQRKLKKLKVDALKKRNRSLRSERLLFEQDMLVAQQLAAHDAFYTPMNCDWRGRVYALPHFNFQREDRVRALFTFAAGEPIGEEGYYWLKVHAANCGDFDKISKRPLKERAEWCNQNLSSLAAVANNPFGTAERELWTKADKPFLFLAACFELMAAIRVGSGYIASIPVSFDGSCSGLQHLSAMTRATEGALVNLTPQSLPQDVYATVAVLVKERIEADKGMTADDVMDRYPKMKSEDAEKRAEAHKAIAQLALDYGVDRKLVKRNVMTYAYSSKKFGMAQQLQVDLMEPLEQETLEGKHEQHPFFPYATGSKDYPSAAARYLASHIFDAIEEVVKRPGEAMKYLQKLAKAMAHEGKPLRWTTPVGIPWINRYHDSKTKRVELWLSDGGVRVRSSVTVAVGEESDINKDKAANGVAPNFVHALDAAHLLLVARAAVREGITSIATVHDSFGCLPSRAKRFNAIIREQFAEMYETHDVLAEVLQQAKCDLTDANWDKLPDGMEFGNLNIKDILNADFAFA